MESFSICFFVTGFIDFVTQIYRELFLKFSESLSFESKEIWEIEGFRLSILQMRKIRQLEVAWG